MKEPTRSKRAIVVTSIASPNPVLHSLAKGAAERGDSFIVVGDSKSPRIFELEGCDFYSLDRQRELPFGYARLCHEKSYARKNIGYLVAMALGAEAIVETDDDNYPQEDFWLERNAMVEVDLISTGDWLNAYAYFSDAFIYPRGFPLEKLQPTAMNFVARSTSQPLYCPIQQGLADGNPDVDAIYRMLFPLPLNFRKNSPIALGPRTWCPFNSQNTTTFREVFALLYLPTLCSFRMTDIWRSFVAQRILWTFGGHVSFHAATVTQDRNIHDLIRDFAEEVPGYLENARIANVLESLPLSEGLPSVSSNLRKCYEKLVEVGIMVNEELVLLDAWLEDLKTLFPVSSSWDEGS
jgi:hypothetical protein